MPETPTFPPLPHQGFALSRLPQWLLQAQPEQRQRLHALAQAAEDARHDLRASLAGLPSVEAFALSHLRPMLARLIDGPVDPGKAVLYWVDPRGKRPPIQRTLVQAALQNFHRNETRADAFGEGSGLFAGLGPDGKVDRTRPLGLRPDALAKACRNLDVGGRFQHALAQQVPARLPGREQPVTGTPDLSWRMFTSLRATFLGHACVAWLTGRLEPEGMALLAHWQMAPEPVPGVSAQAQRLTLLGFPLTGVTVFARQVPDRAGSAVVLYLPEDPEGAVVQYPDMRSLAITLGERLRSPEFLKFFAGFVPLAQRVAFMEKVNAAMAPGRWLPPHLNWEPVNLPGNPFVESYRIWAQQSLAEAASVAVPTARVDHHDSFERYAHWVQVGEQLGLSLALMVGSAIPGVNVIADAIMLGQSLMNVYEGVQAWQRGDTRGAIDHLFGAVENSAFFGLGKRPEPTAVEFSSRLVPVTGADGQVRLWQPAFEYWRAQEFPPDYIVPDSQGVYHHDGRAWLRIDGAFHEITLERGNSARLVHPRQEGFAPLLHGDGNGGWRAVHENPATWDSATLIRRFSDRYQALPEQSLRQLQRMSGISDAQLRRAHLAGTGTPAPLAYLLARELASRQLDATLLALRSNRPLQSPHAVLVEVLSKVPGWPADLALAYRARHGTEVLGPAGASRQLQLAEADFADGSWAGKIIAQLDSASLDALLGIDTSLVPADHAHEVLAGAWAGALEPRRSALIHRLAEPAQASGPARDTLRRQFPGLVNEAVDALMQGCTRPERQALEAGRMPPGLGEQAAEALRQLRVVRACEALARGEAGADRDLLAMGLFSALGPWTSAMQLEVRADHFNGAVLHTTGEPTAPRWVIVRRDQGYQPFDDRGLELGPQGSLEDAIVATFPDQLRPVAAGTVPNASALRTALLEQALSQRETLRPLLGMLPDNRRFFRPPTRQANGAVGYELSGRGRPSAPEHAPEDPYLVALRALYPDVEGAELAELRASLGEGEAATTSLARLNGELSRLRLELGQWVEQAEGSAAEQGAEVSADDRRVFAAGLIALWQRLQTSRGFGDLGYGPILRGLNIGDLPSLSVRFEHAARLSLLDMNLRRVSDAFLASFPNLRWLDLSMNPVEELPNLSGLSRLDRLSLDYSGNQQALPLLEMAVPAADTLTQIDFAGLGLTLGPAEFEALGQFNQLRSLDLEGNAITLTDQTAAGFAQLTQLQELSLASNPLGRPPVVTALTQLTVLDLSDAGISEFPPGLLDLMNQAPPRLRDVNLSDNQIPQIPDITQTPFVLLSRDYYDNIESPHYGMGINLRGNPLDIQSQTMLRNAGLSFYARFSESSGSELGGDLPASDVWLQGCPPALAQAIRQERTQHQAAEFYQLLSRVVETADYVAQSLQTRQRVWALVQTWLLPGDQALPGLEALRDRLFAMAQDTMGTCGDGVALTLDEMEQEVESWRTVANSRLPGDGPLRELLDYQRRVWRWVLVDDIARRIVRAREARHGALQGPHPEQAPPLDPLDDLPDAHLEEGIDEVEVRLYLVQQLETPLDLPPSRGMRYSTRLSAQVVSRVGSEVLGRDTADAFAAWVAHRPGFRTYLEHGQAQAFDPVRERWQEAADYLYAVSTQDQAAASSWPAALDDLRAELPEVNWPAPGQGLPELTDQQVRMAYDWVNRQRQRALDALALELTQRLLGLER